MWRKSPARYQTAGLDSAERVRPMANRRIPGVSSHSTLAERQKLVPVGGKAKAQAQARALASKPAWEKEDLFDQRLHEHKSLRETVIEGFHWGMLPCMLAFLPWMIFALYFKVSKNPSVCFPAPKLYSDYSDTSDTNGRSYDRVKAYLETEEINFCTDFFQYSMSFLSYYVIYLLPLSLLSVFAWRSVKAKRGFKVLLTLVYTSSVICWFYFGIVDPAYAHARTVLWGFFDGFLLFGATLLGFVFDRTSHGWKFYILTYTMMCVVFYFNSYVVPLFYGNKTFMEIYVPFFPIFISLYELLYVRIVSLKKFYVAVNPKAVMMMGKFMLVTFQTYNYAVIVYTYEDKNQPLFIANLIMSGLANIGSRARFLQKGAVKLYNKVQSYRHPRTFQPYILGPRNRFERNYFGMKYEIEYIPLCAILFARWLDWIPLPEYGNHLNRNGEPDPDFELPLWIYLAFIAEAIITDTVTYYLARQNKKSVDLQVTLIKKVHWATLSYFIVIGEAAGIIFNQSATFATYKLETNAQQSTQANQSLLNSVKLMLVLICRMNLLSIIS